MVADVGSLGGAVRVRREGSFGVLPSETATTVAMVLTELLQNAVEHAYPAPDGEGTILVTAARTEAGLDFTVVDDGQGLPAGLRPRRVEQPGALDRGHARGVRARRSAHARAGARPGRGTQAVIDVPL